jgi:hypothetical protein
MGDQCEFMILIPFIYLHAIIIKKTKKKKKPKMKFESCANLTVDMNINRETQRTGNKYFVYTEKMLGSCLMEIFTFFVSSSLMC